MKVIRMYCGKCKLFDIEKTNRDLLEQIDKLKQENRELLEKFDEAQDDIESLTNATNYYFKENEELKISNSNLDNQLYITKEMMNNCNNRLQNYRSALE